MPGEDEISDLHIRNFHPALKDGHLILKWLLKSYLDRQQVSSYPTSKQFDSDHISLIPKRSFSLDWLRSWW